MPAPGTNGIIPEVINMVAGFLHFLANSSPNRPTVRAPKNVALTLLWNIFAVIKYTVHPIAPVRPLYPNVFVGEPNNMEKPIVEKNDMISCFIITN